MIWSSLTSVLTLCGFFFQRFGSVALHRALGFCLLPYICANRWAQFDRERTQYSLLLPLLTCQKDEQAARTTPFAPHVSHILKLKPKKRGPEKKRLFQFNFQLNFLSFSCLQHWLVSVTAPNWKLDVKKQISVIYSKAGRTTQPWAPDTTTHTHESLHARACTHTHTHSVRIKRLCAEISLQVHRGNQWLELKKKKIWVRAHAW